MDLRVEVQTDTRALTEQWGEAAVSRKLRAATEESLQYLKGLVQEGTPVDTGLGRGSVFTAVRGTGLDIEGVVASPQAHMVVLELGRRPGMRMPPLDPIRVWLRRHGQSDSLAFVVARAIGRRGIEARRMFGKAAERGGATVTRIFARHLS